MRHTLAVLTFALLVLSGVMVLGILGSGWIIRMYTLGIHGPEVEAERARTGTSRRGKEPKPVDDAPADKAQTNFTDPELPIMPTNNKGWEYCGNAHVSVDGACQIIIACDVTDASHDTQQAAPVAQATLTTLAQAGIERPTDESGVLQPIPATLDSGYDSEAAAQALED